MMAAVLAPFCLPGTGLDAVRRELQGHHRGGQKGPFLMNVTVPLGKVYTCSDFRGACLASPFPDPMSPLIMFFSSCVPFPVES